MWSQEDPQVKWCHILTPGLLIVFREWICFLGALLGFTYRPAEQKLQSSPIPSYPSSPASNDPVFIHYYSLQSTAYIAVTLCVSSIQFSSAESLSRAQVFATPWPAARQASLFITISQSLLKLMSIELVMPSNCHPLSSPSPPAFSLSQHQGLFQWVSSSQHQVAKVLEFQLQHQSFQWTFRTDLL